MVVWTMKGGGHCAPGKEVQVRGWLFASSTMMLCSQEGSNKFLGTYLEAYLLTKDRRSILSENALAFVEARLCSNGSIIYLDVSNRC
jgi:hypothetical protein